MRRWIMLWRSLVAPAVPVAALVAVAAGVVAPPAALAVDLRDAFVASYLNNPDLSAARDRVRQADELVPQALSGYRPRIFLDSELQAAKGRTYTSGSVDADRTTKTVGGSIQQNLYAGGGTAAAVSRAENQVQAERARLLGSEQVAFSDTVDAYTAVWRDQSVLDLALNNEQRLQRQLEATRDRFEVGEVARTDVAQAEARLSRARADVEAAKADLGASQAAYQRVIGEKPVGVAEPVTPRDTPKSLSDAQGIAATNPQILAATYDLYAARDNVDVAFANLLPSVDLTARYDYADQPNFATRWSREGSIGLSFSVPLYQGGGEYSRVRQNRAAAREQRNQLESAQRSVQELVSSSWDRLLAATAAIASFRDEVRANQIALEGVEQEALVGARTVLDVLDAEQELFTSQVNLVRARREEVVAAYQLKRAMGELTEASLNLPVEPYDPTVHYRTTRTRLFGLAP